MVYKHVEGRSFDIFEIGSFSDEKGDILTVFTTYHYIKVPLLS